VNAIDVGGYLRRIGFNGTPSVDVASLEALQRAHMTTVPFENLHVFHHRGVSTDPESTIPKIVEQGRGGWCYELNGSFSALLESLGFSVTVMGATVLLDEPAGPQPDHATIRVDLDRPYLVDVGFGDSFIRPLPLDQAGPHDGGDALYGFEGTGATTTVIKLDESDIAEPQYRFENESRTPDEFEPASRYLQSEPGLRWTQYPFATRLLDGGPDRVTLLHDRLKVRKDGVWTETPVAQQVWNSELERWFGMSP
jgi:N-hydroxyarylamine O-acetyltransferase